MDRLEKVFQESSRLENFILKINSLNVMALDDKYLVMLKIPNFIEEQAKIMIVKDMLIVQCNIEGNNFDYITRLDYDVDPALIYTSYEDEILKINIPRIDK